ncbi:inclusion protein [Waddlia chondrophila 2032/99]|uniref:Chromosome partition protein Smc n=1 Tax=Waddlia chondrophila 2032/99 TaxID=765953 RepID=F8LF27_9BACT|nr:inclusion protein [Waddlia chondrophila 2032/99]
MHFRRSFLFLKKIKILGFKSFADSTVLEFHPGITAIVGPNGCGKSNISDSFRWVLGEQSAKSMRGSKMNDVIFAGTAKRKPLNLSEVTITLGDVGSALKTEYDEVAVTRRIHRSGESDYLINKRPVRLRDVYDLFMDSGIGKNAFSIFEQGKIEQVIQLSPLERRYIFEEAAGILRFLQRKKEALRRLEQTESNIERVRDIHQEVEKQIIVLERQAEQAKVYKENRMELEELEISLAVARWNHFKNRHDAFAEKEQAKGCELEAAALDLEKMEVERQDANIYLNHVIKELQVQKEEMFKTRSQKEIQIKAWKSQEDRLEEMVCKGSEWQQELEEMIRKRKARQLEAEQIEARKKKVDKELSALEQVRNEFREQLREIEYAVNEIRDRQHIAQQERVQCLQEENKIESERKQTALRLEHHKEKIQRLQENQQMLKERLTHLHEQIEWKHQEIAEGADHIAELKERFSLFESQIEETAALIKQTQHQLNHVSQERAEIKARQNALLRLREEMDGFSKGAKRIIREAGQVGSFLYKKVRGLYEDFPTEGCDRKAISVVMKRYTETLVVESLEDFKAVAAFAEENNVRGFSLLCLEMIPEVKKVSREHSLLDRMVDHPLINFFLKDVIVKERSEELWNAESLARISHRILSEDGQDVRLDLLSNPREYCQTDKVRGGESEGGRADCLDSPRGCEKCELEVWTEDGAYIDRHRVVFFPSEGEENAFVREAELKSLDQKLAECERKKVEFAESLHAFTEQHSMLIGRKQEADQEIRQAEREDVERRYFLERMQADRERFRIESEKEQEEMSALQELSGKVEEVLVELNASYIEQRAKLERRQELVEVLNVELQEKLERLRLQQSQMEEKESVYQKAAVEKRNIEHQLNLLEVKNLESLQREKRLEEEILSIQEKKAGIQLNRADYEQKIERVEQALLKVQEKCRELDESVGARQGDVEEIEKRSKQKREDIRRLERELHEQGLQRAQIDSARQALETEFTERFQMSMRDAEFRAKELEESMEKTERKIRSLRRKIEEAGDINMTSIDEYEKFKERYEFLNQQIRDLTASKGELVEIITKLDGESRKTFKETFDQIQANFRKNFEILFRGGEADLHFTESGDILEAGIEIAAKPPGKKMRSISLLSGGEKCLTAVALLFAIFEVKPSPFCILDEIDAPLDDINVERFLNVVKQFTDRCQFIIITHNKRTMAIADRLFGVSMQERGVSKILSLEFDKREVRELVS